MLSVTPIISDSQSVDHNLKVSKVEINGWSASDEFHYFVNYTEIKQCFLFYITNYLNEEVNCTEPSPLVRIPWVENTCHILPRSRIQVQLSMQALGEQNDQICKWEE
jgi:hypothetical protein